MKEYSIRELSELLGISREMVRYYEKCGAISPSRNNENNYRIYTAIDYFACFEAMCLSRFNANIREIDALKNTDYARQVRELYERYIEETSRNIEVEQLMIERARCRNEGRL